MYRSNESWYAIEKGTRPSVCCSWGKAWRTAERSVASWRDASSPFGVMQAKIGTPRAGHEIRWTSSARFNSFQTGVDPADTQHQEPFPPPQWHRRTRVQGTAARSFANCCSWISCPLRYLLRIHGLRLRADCMYHACYRQPRRTR
jgi:hypothetical protein